MSEGMLWGHERELMLLIKSTVTLLKVELFNSILNTHIRQENYPGGGNRIVFFKEKSN